MMKTNTQWKPCQFNRDEYLEHADLYEAVKIDDATSELCEFNDDAEDLAIELAYMRYRLAKTESDLLKIVEEYDPLENAYWDFDAMRKGDGQYKGHPQAERDAYKMSIRAIISKLLEVGRPGELCEECGDDIAIHNGQCQDCYDAMHGNDGGG